MTDTYAPQYPQPQEDENPYQDIARGLTVLMRGTQRYADIGKRYLEYGQLRIALLQEVANLALDIAEFDAQPLPFDFDRINLRGRIAEIGQLAEAVYQTPQPVQQPRMPQPQATPQQLPPGHRAPYYGPRPDYQMRDLLDRAAQEPETPPNGYTNGGGAPHWPPPQPNGHYPQR
jgi:hypothetical protein